MTPRLLAVLAAIAACVLAPAVAERSRNAAGRIRRHHGLRPRQPERLAPGRERLELQADPCAPAAGRARPRHLRGHGRQLAGALAAARRPRLLRVRAELRLLERQRRSRRLRTGPIAASAEELGAFVQKVLAATGAAQVDMVGHSQGGMMPRYYLRFLGGASKVRTLVGLAPSNHGTTVDGLFTLGKMLPGANSFLGLCQACEEQEAGSPVPDEAQRRRRNGRDGPLHRDRVRRTTRS